MGVNSFVSQIEPIKAIKRASSASDLHIGNAIVRLEIIAISFGEG